MRTVCVWFSLFAALIAAGPALADGEPTARLSDTAIIVPVEEHRVHVLDQRVTITLPTPKDVWKRPAVVRAEYVLQSDHTDPLTITVGWLTAGIRYWYSADAIPPSCTPAIKLDGKPVGYNFLSFDDLADEYVGPWSKRVNELLESKPALKEQVLRIRHEARARGNDWPPSDGGVGVLAQWMRQAGLALESDADAIAGGLLGVRPSNLGNRRDFFVQRALAWLDPTHQQVDVYAVLSRRWSHDTRLLDPFTRQLVDTRHDMFEQEPPFGVFRFPVTLEPGKSHGLIVQYGQFVGGAAFPKTAWYGLVYLMEPARRWGKWERTSVEIKVPTDWKTVAIRPAAAETEVEAGYRLYRILLTHRPWENLYLSVTRTPGLPIEQARWVDMTGRFMTLCATGRATLADKEILAEGKASANAALRRLLSQLKPSDSRRFQVAFTMFCLGFDLPSSRAALIDHTSPGKPGFNEDVLQLVTLACWRRPDSILLSRLLDLPPRTDGAAAAVMQNFLSRLAAEKPRALLTGLSRKPEPVWHTVSHLLPSPTEGRPSTRPYPRLSEIAEQQRDPLQPLAARLVDKIKKSVASQLARRPEKSRFPLVPKGVHLPPGAVAVLQSSHPDWHVMGTKGFDVSVVKSVRSRFGEDAGPQHCWGDFDGNGLRDVALLIRRNIGDGVKLIVLRQLQEKRWVPHELHSFSFGSGFQGGYSGFTIYLTPRSPGTVEFWHDQGKTGKLDLTSDGIKFNFEGKASVLYYWNGSGYSTVQTGD